MQLSIKTPYGNLIQNFDGFTRLICKTTDAVLVIQNRSPAAMHILPAGSIKVKFVTQQKGISGDYMHSGGFLFVHSDNTCQINLVDAYQRKDIKADLIDKVEIKDTDTLAGKYASKMRKSTCKSFLKKVTT